MIICRVQACLARRMSLSACACRPVGRMFAPYMAFSSDYGAVTDQQSCVLILVFSEPIVGLVATQFKVSGPTSTSVTGLKLLQGTSSYYHALVVIAASYTGQVTVTFSVSLRTFPQTFLDSYKSLKVHLMHLYLSLRLCRYWRSFTHICAW